MSLSVSFSRLSLSLLIFFPLKNLTSTLFSLFLFHSLPSIVNFSFLYRAFYFISFLPVCLSVSQSVYLFVSNYLFPFLSFLHLSLELSLHKSHFYNLIPLIIILSIPVSLYYFLYLSLYLSTYHPTIYRSVYLFFYPFIYLTTYLPSLSAISQ